MATTRELPADVDTRAIAFSVNGRSVVVSSSPSQRLSRVLRDGLSLTGTKVGCDAGDCGACTVLLDGEPVCACLVAAGQVAGHEITTVEGLQQSPTGARLQQSFLTHGAAQCGACTPGMLVAATALLDKNHAPNESEVMDAIGGVLCRCTGYRKIINAVLDVEGGGSLRATPDAGQAVGNRLVRLDGQGKVTGVEVYGADEIPVGALMIRVVRCPFHRARFRFGDLNAYVAENPGVSAVLTAKDVPGENRYGVIPRFADQPVFAESEARFRGEAVAAVVGDIDMVERLDLSNFPVFWEELPPLMTIDDALAPDAPRVHADRKENVLVRGRVVCGDVDKALSEVYVTAEAEYETGFVEHACIEPEAGFARRVGDTIEIQACTQSPYMDRSDIAKILGVAPEAVRIIPTAVGGGFGTKLDLSVQPFLALAAWRLRRPVRMVYSRIESIMATTKRHPARMRGRAGATKGGELLALDFTADFNTGAYSSWGPTVAARAEAVKFNATTTGPIRRGVGVAGMWYGCGNTSLPNPSTVRIGLKRDGRIALHQGAVDIGQGSNTIVTQICADALCAAVECFDLISGDTSITPDCGKTSASR